MISSDSFELIKLYPNPVTDLLNLSIEIPNEGKYSIEIYNENGEFFPTGINMINYPAGIHDIKIGTMNLINGSYYIVIRTDDSFVFEKFIVTR